MIVKTYEDVYNWYVVIEKDNDQKCSATFYTYVWSKYENGELLKSFNKNDDEGCNYTEDLEEAMRKAVLIVSARGVWQEELQTADCDCFDPQEIFELAEILEDVQKICYAEIVKTCPNAATY